jgi:hypothetical protein
MKNSHWVVAGLIACLIPVWFLWATWPTGHEITVSGYGKPDHQIHWARNLRLEAGQTTTTGKLDVYGRELMKINLPQNTACSIFSTKLKPKGAVVFTPTETAELTYDWQISSTGDIEILVCGNKVPQTIQVSHKCLHGDSPAVARVGRSAELKQPIIAEVK